MILSNLVGETGIRDVQIFQLSSGQRLGGVQDRERKAGSGLAQHQVSENPSH